MKWEYWIEAVSVSDRWTAKGQAKEIEHLRSRLNQLGAEGWEMVSLNTIPLFGRFSDKQTSALHLGVFKRAI